MLFILYFLNISLIAKPYQYLFDDPYKTLQNSTFAGPKIQQSYVNAKTSTLLGVQGAWSTNDTLFIGGYLMGSSNINKPNIDYIGMMIGYNFESLKYYHPSISIAYGKGAVTRSIRKTLIISSRTYSQNEIITVKDSTLPNSSAKSYDAFFSDLSAFTFIEAQASMKININKWLRIAPTIGYKHIIFNDPTQISYNAKDFSGFSYGLDINIGWWVNMIKTYEESITKKTSKITF
jgi:hypothetical protein